MATVDATATPALPVTAPVGADAGAAVVDAPPADDSPFVAPPRQPFTDTITRAITDARLVAGDGAHLLGVRRGEDGPQVTLASIAPVAAINGAVAAGFAASEISGLAGGFSGLVSSNNGSVVGALADTGTIGVKNFFLNGLRLSPAAISGVAAPSVATMALKPFGKGAILDPKAQIVDATTGKLRARTKPEEDEVVAQNQRQKLLRGAVAAAGIGLAAGAVFLIKPDLFKGALGSQFVRDSSINWSTRFTTALGQSGHVAGALDEVGVAAALASAGRSLAPGDSITKVARFAGDAVFTNRVIAGAVGGGATALAGYKAYSDRKEGKPWGGWATASAVAGAATIGTIIAMPRLVGGSALLSANTLFMKPDQKWLTDYGVRIFPQTGAMAGASAYTYSSTVNEFDKVTDAKSPWLQPVKK